MRRDRVLGALVAILGVGIAASLVALVHLSNAVNENRAQLHRQDDVIHQLADAVAEAQQDASAQRRLVQALQRQVLDCQRHRGKCGPPLTEPPSVQPAAGTGESTPGPVSTPTATPRPSPTATPRPSPSPTPSPSPHPSPSPSVCIPNVRCLPIGVALPPVAPARHWLLA